jgi:5S rRNA maturation endonuclease (ribonuclease M5)
MTLTQTAWDDWRAAVKADVDLREVIGRTVKLQGRDPAKGCCPFHEERTPSFAVYKDHYHCYGSCQERGDLFDWLEKHEGLDRRAAEVEAERISAIARPNGLAARPATRAQDGLGASTARAEGKDTREAIRGGVSSVPEVERPAPTWIEDLADQAHAALLTPRSDEARQALAYLRSRGLEDLLGVVRFGVVDHTVRVPAMGREIERYRHRLLIPFLEGERAVWLKARYLGSSDDVKAAGAAKYYGPRGAIPAPFNSGGIHHANEAGFLVVTEGELDAASLLATFGPEYPVVGLPGGRLHQEWAERIAQTGAKVYLLTDADGAGEKHRADARKALEGQGVKVYDATLPGHKDVNEALVALGADALADLVDATLQGAGASRVSDATYIGLDFLLEADARFNRPHRSHSTGMRALDLALGGGYTEGLQILGGITGGGKTSLALSIALHNALEGRTVIYATYEQSRYELWARIAAKLTGIPQKAIKRGFYESYGETIPVSQALRKSQGWQQVESAARHLKIVEGGDALSRTAGDWTVEVLSRTARDVKDETGVPPLVIVDYLQRVPLPAGEKTREIRERVSYVAGALQVNVARAVGCPVLALSSLGRSAYGVAQTATLEDKLKGFKEAGELEYTAYTALLLYGVPREFNAALKVPAKTLTTPHPPVPMALELVKNREGERTRLVAFWKPGSDTWEHVGTWPDDGQPARDEVKQ